MNIKQLIKKERANMPKKIEKKLRIRIAKIISVIATLPLGTSWMFLISIPMSMAISPTVWAKGRLNERKGNGDLKCMKI